MTVSAMPVANGRSVAAETSSRPAMRSASAASKFASLASKDEPAALRKRSVSLACASQISEYLNRLPSPHS